MRKQILLGQLASTPWAMDPAHLANLANVLNRWQSGESASLEATESVKAAQAARSTRKAAAANVSGGIAVLPLWGVLTQKANLVQEVSGGGGTSTQQFAQSFRDAMADDSVSGILIDLDSPGGSVFGTDELAAEIFSARGGKPVIGFVNSLCASAAYWVGAQCDEIYSTAGGQTGSIGVFMQHVDESAAMDKAGLKAEFVSAGKFKTEGNSLGPLGSEARAHLQSQVDTYYQAFTSAVARGRGVPVSTVRNGMGQGRCLTSGDALKAGMINGIDTFDGVVARLSQRIKGVARQAPGRSGQGAAAATMASSQRRALEIARAAGGQVKPIMAGSAQTRAAQRRREIELAAI